MNSASILRKCFDYIIHRLSGLKGSEKHCGGNSYTLPASDYPRVIAGTGWGIVENVGGDGGLQRLQEAFVEHRGDEYAEYSQWLGVTEFDLHAFDLDEMNQRLKKIPPVYRKVYEANQQPSEAMIRYIQRI
ncbi:IS1096 element passenger TnpR family protein [Lacticaseibacillus manihotivorans]|nr:hypothetical protein [Lacticaseibacillus manihotivorans]